MTEPAESAIESIRTEAPNPDAADAAAGRPAAPVKKRRNSTLSRRRLLEAAIAEFSARGPHATTLDDICGVASLNKRLVYHYYGDKQALYTAALKYVYSQFFSLEVELGSMLLPVEQLLEVLVERYYVFLRDHPTFLRMISFENLDGGRTAATLNLAGQKAPVITALRLALEKGKADGNFALDVDVNHLLVDIFALCYFYFSNSATMNLLLGENVLSPASVAQRIRHVVRLLLHGILHDDKRRRDNSPQEAE